MSNRYKPWNGTNKYKLKQLSSSVVKAKNCAVFEGDSELELRVRDSSITNQFLDSTNQKFVKLPFFMNCFFPKYDNFKITSTNDILMSVFLFRVGWVRLKYERTKFWELCRYTLKLKFIINFFSLSPYYDNPLLCEANNPPSLSRIYRRQEHFRKFLKRC